MRKLDWLLVAGVLIAIGWGVYVMYDALNPSKRYNTSLWRSASRCSASRSIAAAHSRSMRTATSRRAR